MNCDDYLPDVLTNSNGTPWHDDDIARRHVSDCPRCSSDQADFQGTLRLLHAIPEITPAPDLFKRLLDRIEKEPALLPRRRHPFHLIRHPKAQFWGKIAAGLLLAVSLALTFEQFGPGSGPTLARLVDLRLPGMTQPPVRVTRAGDVLPMESGGELRRSETLVSATGSAATFELPGVGTVRTNGAGRLRLKGAREMALDAGVVYCEIEPGRGGYKITTPSAVVQVTGTRFYVRSTPDWTAVLVLDGSVRLGNPAGLVNVPASHRALARSSRPPSSPEPIAAVADNRINPLAALGPDPTVELLASANEYVARKPATLRLRLSSESDDLWIEPYHDASPYYLLSIAGENEPPHTVRIVGAQAAAALSRQPDGEAQNIRRGEFYDVSFDLAALIRKPGVYEISGIFVSAGAAEKPLWVGVAQSAPITIRIREN